MTIDYFCKSPKHPLEPGKLDSLPVWLRGSGGDSICASWKGREAPGDYVVEDEGLVAAVNAALVLARARQRWPTQ
jgi:hypothetical protein